MLRVKFWFVGLKDKKKIIISPQTTQYLVELFCLNLQDRVEEWGRVDPSWEKKKEQKCKMKQYVSYVEMKNAHQTSA